MKQLRRQRNCVWFIGMIVIYFGLIGCSRSTISIKQYPYPDGKMFENAKTVEGVSAIADPLMSQEDQINYFGTDLIAKGILPIYLAVKNNNSDQSFILDAESIEMRGNDTGTSTIDPASDLKKKAENMGTATLVLGGSLLMLNELAKADSNVAKVENNFELNRFRTSTLGPGQMASGFLYANWDDLKNKDSELICFQLFNPIDDKAYLYCLNIYLRGAIQ